MPAQAATMESADVDMEVPEAKATDGSTHVDMELPEVTAVEGSTNMPSAENLDATIGRQPTPKEFETLDSDSTPGLSNEDLASLGLDGASAWIQMFSGRLTALASNASLPTSKGAVELLLRIVHNIVSNPHNEKFRRLKSDNAKIRNNLLSAGPEVEKLMTLLGFESAIEDGGNVLVLRDSMFDNVRLRMGQELLEQQLSRFPITV
jgi:hypothetical protein